MILRLLYISKFIHQYILSGSTIIERYNAAEKRIIAANDFFLKKNLNLDELKRRWEVRLHEMQNGRYIPEDPNLTMAKACYAALKRFNNLRYDICQSIVENSIFINNI